MNPTRRLLLHILGKARPTVENPLQGWLSVSYQEEANSSHHQRNVIFLGIMRYVSTVDTDERARRVAKDAPTEAIFIFRVADDPALTVQKTSRSSSSIDQRGKVSLPP